MSEEAATLEVSADTKELGDKIVELTLKQAKELSDYLKDEYGIEAASGGVVAMAPAGAGGDAGEAEVEKTAFDVVLTGFGDNKISVVKVLKKLTGLSLIEAKKLVENAPVTLKEALSQADADAMKAELEESGASVELK